MLLFLKHPYAYKLRTGTIIVFIVAILNRVTMCSYLFQLNAYIEVNILWLGEAQSTCQQLQRLLQ